jgi:outer membrane protein with beta-barrel domain
VREDSIVLQNRKIEDDMRSTWSLRAVLLAAFAASLAATPALAQKSTTRGFTIAAHLQGGSLAVEDENGDLGEEEPAGGGGFGVRAGYGFNRHFTSYFEIDGIVFDTPAPDFGGYWGMAHVDLGLRYSFANSLRRWVPFLEGALGVRGVNVDEGRVDGQPIGDLNFSGGAASLGGGISFFPTEKLAIETLMKFTAGTFEQVERGNIAVRNLDIDAASFRFKIGLAWWP